MKTAFAIILGKLIFYLSRFFKLGGGFAAPGLYALKIDPDLINKLIDHKAKNIVITGTNGKTTTSKLISHFLIKKGTKIIRNTTGSNLERGIASYLISHTNIFGKLDYDFGVWELDEFAFNSVAPKIKPGVVILLNVFRDQLDRYGEVDKIIERWQETLSKLEGSPVLIINQDDTGLLKVLKNFRGKVLTFGVKDSKIIGENKSGISGKPDYEAIIIDKNLRSHLKGGKLNKTLENIQFKVSFNGGSSDFTLPLPGIFNVYNFLASFICACLFNLDALLIRDSLFKFTPAFGRNEKFEVNGRRARIFLIKNPVGATQVFETILPHISKNDSLLLALNDNFADGKDVSWIWDIELERLKIKDLRLKIVVSGSRSYDLALRLKYAGVDNPDIEQDLNQAFEKAVDQTKGKLFILPTYTAMLELQKILVRKGIKKHYWKD